MGGWGDSEAVHSMESKFSASNDQIKSYQFECSMYQASTKHCEIVFLTTFSFTLNFVVHSIVFQKQTKKSLSVRGDM